MSLKAKIFLAKLLIVFSVILILCGGILHILDNKVLHPIDDVSVVVGGDSGGVSVTPVDDLVPDIVKPGDGGSGGSEQNPVETPPPVVSPCPSPSPSASTKPSPSIEPSPSPSPSASIKPSSSPSPVVPEVGGEDESSLDDVNARLRNIIEVKYGITVKYGNETSGYSVGGMSTYPIADAQTANIALTDLDNCLSLYPEDFFREIRRGGYPLTIHLIKRYSTANVTGVTDSSNRKVSISIATDYDLADSIHHELYHYIEKYIFTFGFRFTSWDTLNPLGFTYGTVNSSYSYATTYSENAYFVNNYAQTDQYEDRASTFEYMMKSSKISGFNNGNVLWNKAKIMCEQIDYYLESVNSYTTEYWERHIY